MANYSQLKDAIEAVIKTNNQRAITGQILQNVLTQMVNSIGENYQLAGFATPLTDPNEPDQNVFYVTSTAGVYSNFDNLNVGEGLTFLMWKNAEWTAQTINLATQSWVADNYISKEFFRRLFRAFDENGLEISPNDTTTIVDNIKAMVGFWTEQYISALGKGDDGGTTIQTLAQLNDVQLSTLSNGQALVYNSTLNKWVNGEAGVNMQSVWTALAGNTNEQIAASHLSVALSDYVTNTALSTALAGYVTDAELSSALSSYVTNATLSSTLANYGTKDWIAGNYVSIAYFNRLFQAYSSSTIADENKVEPNDLTTTINNLKFMVGSWTEQFLSALGYGSDGGGAISTLAQLTDVELSSPTNGQVLMYNSAADKWVNGVSMSGSINPVDMETLTPSDTFSIGDAIALNGVIYRAVSATSNFPIPLVTSGNNFVINEYKGYKAYVIRNENMQAGWEVWLDSGLSYWVAKHEDRLNLLASRIDDLENSQTSPSSFNAYTMWQLLAQAGGEQINSSHLSDALGGYATESWVSSHFNNYSLPLAANGTRGGVQVGYSTNGKNYAVQLNGEKMFVNVPWTDNNTTYTNGTGLSLSGTTFSINSTYQNYISHGETAYGWGNHANAGYATSSALSGYLPLTGGTISGSLGIGVSPSYKLHVDGDIYATGGVSSLSDVRHKDIKENVDLSVENIAKMRAVRYSWKDSADEKLHVGSIAQDWESVLPEVVLIAYNEEKTRSLQYGVAALISSIVTARKVVEHEKRIADLERECERLRIENE